MPVILYVRVSTPHPQRHPHPKPTLIHRRGYHHPDYRRLLRRSPCAEHGACTPASGSLTGGYGRGGWRVCRRVSAARPSSTDPHQGTCHGHFAWAADEGGLPRHRDLEIGVLTPHQPHAYPLSGHVQPGDHRLSADGVHRHGQPLRPWAEALTPCFPQRVGVKPPPEDTGVNPVRRRQAARGEALGPRWLAPAGLGKGMRRGRLDRPTLDRPCQGAPGGGFTTGVGVSPTPLARHAVPPRWWLEAVDPSPTPPLWLADPGGVTLPSQRLTPRPGRRAAAARPHRLEWTRQRRLAPRRRGGCTAATPRPLSANRRWGLATTQAAGFRPEESR